MVGNMVFKLSAGLKGYGINNKMVMDIICIKVCSNNNFVIPAPHTPCGFHTDFVRFLRCNLARLKALIPVIRYIAARFAKAFFRCRHTLICSFCIAVDTRHIHTLIRFLIICRILQGGV